jgi:hypothetical protein
MHDWQQAKEGNRDENAPRARGEAAALVVFAKSLCRFLRLAVQSPGTATKHIGKLTAPAVTAENMTRPNANSFHLAVLRKFSIYLSGAMPRWSNITRGGKLEFAVSRGRLIAASASSPRGLWRSEAGQA